MLRDILLNTAAHKIMRFLTLHRDSSFYDKEISEQAGLSRGMANQLLNQLLEAGVVARERRGRMWFYHLNDSPLVPQYRIFENIVMLNELVHDLKPFVKRIVLFGSAAKGGDTTDSDIDLFIISAEQDRVLDVILQLEGEQVINPVIHTSVEYATARRKNKGFYKQVEAGLILYEEEADEQRL